MSMRWSLTIFDRNATTGEVQFAVSTYNCQSARDMLRYYKQFVKPYHAEKDVVFARHGVTGDEKIYSLQKFLQTANFSVKRKRHLFL